MVVTIYTAVVVTICTALLLNIFTALVVTIYTAVVVTIYIAVVVTICRAHAESGGTRRRTGGEVKGKEANGVGSH